MISYVENREQVEDDFFKIGSHLQVLFISASLSHIPFAGFQPHIVFGSSLSFMIARKVSIQNKSSAIHPLLFILFPITGKINSGLRAGDTEETQFTGLRSLRLVSKSKPFMFFDNSPLLAGMRLVATTFII